MPRLRPGMEILHVNVCAWTCCTRGRAARKEPSSCSWSILGKLFAAKVLRPGHRGTGDIRLTGLAEGQSAELRQAEKKTSQPITPSLKPWQGQGLPWFDAQRLCVSQRLWNLWYELSLGPRSPEGRWKWSCATDGSVEMVPWPWGTSRKVWGWFGFGSTR